MFAPTVLSVATTTPPYLCSLEDMVTYALTWVKDKDHDFQKKVEKIFRHAQVDKRFTVLPLQQIFSPLTFQEKNDIYQNAIVPLAETVLKQALEKAGLLATDIDCIITTSCTGHMSPSIEAHLINRLEMKPTVQRMPVMEMGCVGGVAGLIYAENYLRAYPDRHVALISAELTSITFQRDDFSWANIVSAAIFGDGVACAILGPSKPNELKPKIQGSMMYHFQDSIDLLGFYLSDTGFRMILDEKIPKAIEAHFDECTEPLLSSHQTTLQDIDHYIIHPGGKSILHDVSMRVRQFGKNVDASKAILRDYGNMSSATVLFILQKIMENQPQPGDKGLMLGFGPGFTANTILLSW